MKARMMTVAEAKKLMNRPIKRSARKIAKALECYRMSPEDKKKDCPDRKCPYNNNCAEYGYWCCGNSIMFDAVRKLRQQDEEIKKLKKKIVRCKDCKHWWYGNYCDKHGKGQEIADWFCADGERK